MKKFIFSLVAMFAVILSANAQYNVSGHKFFDNWSVGTDGGVTTNLHDWDNPNGGVWGVQITKGVTPVVSFEFSGQLGFNNNANWNVARSVNAVDNVIVLGSTKINLMNWFCGYNGTPRLFEVQARVGAGYMRNFYTDNGTGHGYTDVNSTVAKLGLDFDFNLGKAKAWTISVRPSVVLRGSNGVSGCDNLSNCMRYSHNAVGQVTAGVTYHFPTSNKKHHYVNVEPVEKVVEKVVTNVVTKKVEVPVEKVVTNSVVKNSTTVVNFAFNSDVLDDVAKAALDKVVGKVNVVAYASPEGSNEYNNSLSQRRANAVKAYLENKGVTVLKCNGAGVVGNASNRIAIVTIVE